RPAAGLPAAARGRASDAVAARAGGALPEPDPVRLGRPLAASGRSATGPRVAGAGQGALPEWRDPAALGLLRPAAARAAPGSTLPDPRRAQRAGHPDASPAGRGRRTGGTAQAVLRMPLHPGRGAVR